MNRVLITGASGYIGSNLVKYFYDRNYTVTAVSSKPIEHTGVSNRVVDLANRSEIVSVLQESRPDIVIHTVWVNSLIKCESDKDLANFVNISLSSNLIKAISDTDTNIKIAFISSDYVFDGEKGGYREDDECMPRTYYGQTKVKVEDLIRSSGIKHIICRTANVFCNGGNFFNFLFGKLSSNETVSAYYDTFFTPTYMQYFLDSFESLISADFEGTIHVAGPDRISRYNFAFQLAAAMGKREDLVVPAKVPSEMLIAHDSSLNSERFRAFNANYCPRIDRSLQFLLGRIEYPYFAFSDSRGSILGITQASPPWEEINYIEAGQGTVRGNHYHKVTREGFFIIEGRVRVEIRKVGSEDKIIFTVKKGDIFYIEPMQVHCFHVLENAKWINFLSKAMFLGHKDIYNE